jgi:hypothetical protein
MLIVAISLALSGAVQASDPGAVQAGVSAAIHGQVKLTRPSAKIVEPYLQSGDPIFLGDVIATGDKSGMQIMLLNYSVVAIGPNCNVTIDESVYDPSTSVWKSLKQSASDTWLFITGGVNKAQTPIKRHCPYKP